jgi:hypothetical protein
MSILQDAGSYMGRAYENPNIGYLISTLLDARKLCSLVITMLMSILYVDSIFTGRAYENRTPIGARKLCSLVISMLMSILQDVGTYMGRAYENPTSFGARNLYSLFISVL